MSYYLDVYKLHKISKAFKKYENINRYERNKTGNQYE